MKKNLNLLVLSALVAVVFSSCTSDDNTPPNKEGDEKETLLVLDKMEVTGYQSKIENGKRISSVLDSEMTCVFEYDAYGRVESTKVDDEYEMSFPEGSGVENFKTLFF